MTLEGVSLVLRISSISYLGQQAKRKLKLVLTPEILRYQKLTFLQRE